MSAEDEALAAIGKFLQSAWEQVSGLAVFEDSKKAKFFACGVVKQKMLVFASEVECLMLNHHCACHLVLKGPFLVVQKWHF